MNYHYFLQVHNQPCHIVYTDYRPTPLQHYIYPAGGDGLYLVVDEKGKFRDSSFQKAVNALSTNDGGDGNKKENGKWQKGGKGGAGVGENSDIFKIVKMIMLRQFDPVIVFSFSKRNCEENALKVSCSGHSYSLFNCPPCTSHLLCWKVLDWKLQSRIL